MFKSSAIRSFRASELSFCSNKTRIIPSISKIQHLCIANATRHFSLNLRRRFPQPPLKNKPTIHENIYTIPNLLTASRILACPVLGWSILDGNYHLATGLLVYAGLTDLVCRYIVSKVIFESWLSLQADGYLARRFKMSSVLGTILDPAADKALMTTLTITLTMQELIPG
jgi:cardiolipin synthase